MTDKCKAIFKKLAGKSFSDDEINDFVERIAQKAQDKLDARSRGDDLEGETQTISQILDELTKEELKEFAIRKHLAGHQKRAEVELAIRWNDIDAVNQTQRLKALNVGHGMDTKGGHMGVDQRSRARSGRWLGDMRRELEKAEVWHLVNQPFFGRFDDNLDRDIHIELSRKAGGSDEATGNADAEKIAEIVSPYIMQARAGLNDVGAMIGELKGYVTPQNHDALKVAGGFFKGRGASGRVEAMREWRQFIEPLLDPKTFDGVLDRTEFLNRIWSNIVSGNHEKSSGTALDGALAHIAPPVGQSALANRLSQERVLHFRTAADGHAYAQKYSRGTTMNGVVRHLEQAAANAELMRVYGPNPDARFENLLRGIEATAAPQDRVSSVLKQDLRQAEFDQLTGAAHITKNVRLSTAISAVKTIQVVSKLGGMTLSSMGDNAFAAQTMRRVGIPLIEGYSNAFAGITRLKPREQKLAADLVNVNSRVMAGSAISRFAASDGAGGLLNRLQQKFYKANMFDFWQRGLRQGVGSALTRFVGDMSGTKWNRLPKETKATFEAYGIGRTLWDAVRGQARIVETMDTGKLLTPDMIRVDDKLMDWAKVNGIADPARARDEARLRFDAFYQDIADRSMTEPKAAERAILRFGSTKGTAWGSFVDVMAQFKSFPTTVLTQHVIPAAKGTAGLEVKGAVANLIIGATVLGYFAMQSKQLVKGRTFKPVSGKTAVAAFLQGGGAGIFGDFIFADYNRFGGGFLETSLGPTAGSLTQFSQVMQAMFTEDDAGPKALRGVVDHTPFANLFYTRAALDYLILFQAQEWMNPGSLRRMERNMERERGQKYRLPPSNYIPTGGGKPFEHLDDLAEDIIQ